MKDVNRIAYLDVAKALGVIGVMALHSCGIPFLEVFIQAFIIPLFFVVSGYLCKEIKDFTLKELIHKRGKQILRPYFIYNIILGAVFLLKVLIGMKNIQEVPINLIGVFYSRYVIDGKTVFLSMGNNPLWFLTAMFVAYVIFYVILAFERKGVKPYYVMPFLLLVSWLFTKVPILLPWSIDTAFFFAFFILCGYYLRKVEFFERVWKWYQYLLLYGAALIIFVMLSRYNAGLNLSVRSYGERGDFSIVYCMIDGVLGSILCITLSKLAVRVRMDRLLSIVGKNTLPIFGFHLFVFSIYDKAVSIFTPYQRYKVVVDIMRIILTIVVILIVQEFIKKHAKWNREKYCISQIK